MKKFNFLHIPYIIILILLAILMFKSGDKVISDPKPKTDTVYVEKIVRDTIKGKTIKLKGKTDTIWLKDPNYIPKADYSSLLNQYEKLGNSFFERNYFSTKYVIESYGYVIVEDSVVKNNIFYSKLTSQLTIPEKTITIVETLPSKRQVYAGLVLTGNQKEILNAANFSILFKDKKDRLFGSTIGITTQGPQFGIQSYLKIKFKD